MLKGLSFLALRAFPLLLLSAPAWAGSTVSVSVNGGPQTAYTDSQGTFSISTLNGGGGNNASGALVSFSAPSLGHFVTMDFLPLGGQTLEPGIYDNVQHVGAQSPLQPGLSVQVDDVFCNSASGRFVVHSITRSGTTITSLDADFQQNCLSSTGTVTSTVTGSLRYMDTTPIPYPTPTADAGTNQIVTQGATVVLDGSLSLPGNGTITAYTWTQLSGVSVTLNDVSTVAPSFTAPSVPLGGSDLVFQLQVDNSLADSSIGTVKVHVANPVDPESIYSYTSDSSNDPVGRGGSGSFGVLQAIFTPSTLTSTASHAGSGVQVTVNAGPANSWTLQFAAPVGESLQVGTSYDLAQSAPASAAGVPALDAQTTFSPGSCATAFGRFTVLDLQTDVDGNVTSFAADFVQNCSGKQASLHGKIRYNSSLPLDDPFADAGGEMLGVPGAVITLSATGSDAGDGQDITSYQWVQVSGPTVTLSDPSAASPTFTAPGVGSTGTDLVFQLTVTNADGLSGTDEVTVHLPGSSEPVSVLHVASDAGDTVGLGTTTDIDAIHATFEVNNFTNSIGTGLSVSVSAGASPGWQLNFEAPAGQTLQAGSYDAAMKEPATTASHPGLIVDSNNVLCSTITGHFTVLDIQRDGSGNVTSFAADFEEHCNGAAAGLHGKIRYNSLISIDDPTVQTGAPQWVMQGDVATLDASGSDPGGAGVTLTGYQWTQLSGVGVTLSDVTAAQPTFTAPNVAPGGADLTFQVTVTNSVGATATGTAKVHVASAGDPTPTSVLYLNSTAGEPIGQGQSQSIGSGQASFTVAALGNGLKATVTAASQTWTLTMFPPTGQLPQSPKTYDNAGRATTSGFFPELSVENSGSGCSFSTGRFSILDLQTDANGTITSLAVDFVQYCDDLPSPLYGKLRYNSGVALTTPFADAGPAQEAPQVTSVTLGGSSYAGGGGATLTSYQWTQLSGPTVSLSDATVAKPSFTAPDVDLGGADLVFQLTVTNSLGLSGSDTVTVHVTNPADPVTVFQAFSDAGDPAGGGLSADLNSVQAGFSTTLNGSSVSYTVAGVQGGWTVTLAPPSGQSLQVGDYESAVGSPGQAPVLPGMAVFAGNDNCHTINGHFTVLQVQRNGNGLITSFAADFTQHCNGLTAALRGRLRFNSNVPLDTPFPDAGGSQTVPTGNNTVTLSAGGSDAGGDGETITSVQWTQVSGTTVTLSGSTSSSPTFSTAGLSGSQDLVFEVTITNSDGVTSTDEVTIHVQDPSGAKTRLYMESDPGDFVGQGVITDLDAFSALLSGAGAPGSLGFNANAGVNDSFSLDFSAPTGQSFQLGQFYNQAQRFSSASSPGISIGGNDGCNEDDGKFIVRDYHTNQSGTITVLAVDFVQYCEDGTAGLYGWLRLNSAVPMDTPFAVAGPAQTTYTGMAVTLDGSGSHVGPDGTLNYTWTQVVAQGDPAVTITSLPGGKATFTAPTVPAGGKTLTFQLTIGNGHGMTDTSTVSITVGSESDPKTLFYYISAPTDPAGMGTSGMLTSADHDMSQVSESLDGATVFMQSIPPLESNWLVEFSESNNTPVKGPGTGTFFVTPGSGAPPFMLATMGDQDCEGGIAGTYVVRDIGVNTDGEGLFQISRLAVDFIQFCDGSSGPLIGAYRYNSKVPVLVNDPAANAGPNLIATSPGLVTLDGSASFPGWSGPVSYRWTQVSGPTVRILGGAKPVASFELPASVMSTKGTVLAFQLVVSNSSGSSTAQVTVTAKQQFTSLVSFHSDAGDPIGQGQTASYSLPDGSLTVQKHPDNSLQAVMPSNGYWVLDFAAQNKQPLKIGTYSGATLYKMIGTRKPGLSVSAAGHNCSSVSGDFTVLDVQYQGNAVSSLAVDFDQSCNGSSASLHGKLRYHSAVP